MRVVPILFVSSISMVLHSMMGREGFLVAWMRPVEPRQTSSTAFPEGRLESTVLQVLARSLGVGAMVMGPYCQYSLVKRSRRGELMSQMCRAVVDGSFLRRLEAMP